MFLTLSCYYIYNNFSDVHLNDTYDRTIRRWMTDGQFSAALHSASHPVPGCSLVCDTWAPLRVRMFLWLALRRKQWTADCWLRHGLDANEACFLCGQEPESIDHIVVSCFFKQACMVECPLRDRSAARYSQLRHNLRLVERMEIDVVWQQQARSRHFVHLSCLGDMEGEECKMLPWRHHLDSAPTSRDQA